MNDNRQRELIAEEVAEAEVTLIDTRKFSTDELAAINDRLGELRTQAASLGMPTTKIDQLKLRVASAMAPGPGPRGFEKIHMTNLPAPPPPTAIPANSPGGDKIKRKLEEQAAEKTARNTKAVEDLFK